MYSPFPSFAKLLFVTLSLLVMPHYAFAAEYHLDGSELSLVWGIPFVGILLSIAIMPLLLPHFWHQHYGKVALFWGSVLVVPFVFLLGWEISLFEALHVTLLEYLPFITLLLALYVTAGGVLIKINQPASPLLNSFILLCGAFLASCIGTTGAAMVLIRPLITINHQRKNKVHIVVFFIFLVANIGGSLSPIGDPPLFLGFLKGVPFFWPTVHLFPPMLIAISYLLPIFFCIDLYFYRKEKKRVIFPHSPTKNNDTLRQAHFESPIVQNNEHPQSKKPPLIIAGLPNIFLLLCIVAMVILSGIMPSFFTIKLFGITLESPDLIRDVVLLLIVAISLKISNPDIRKQNFFSWEPILEVAKLFAAIFATIVPVIAILKAGADGHLSFVIDATSLPNGEPNNVLFFWITGMLSSFLDNAPTYLVFFNAAGGNSAILTTELSNTLLAISIGAVFMGANTYIGNAPNFIVKAIAESRDVPMPSFFGYMLWSLIFLAPLFTLISFLFF